MRKRPRLFTDSLFAFADLLRVGVIPVAAGLAVVGLTAIVGVSQGIERPLDDTGGVAVSILAAAIGFLGVATLIVSVSISVVTAALDRFRGAFLDLLAIDHERDLLLGLILFAFTVSFGNFALLAAHIDSRLLLVVPIPLVVIVLAALTGYVRDRMTLFRGLGITKHLAMRLKRAIRLRKGREALQIVQGLATLLETEVISGRRGDGYAVIPAIINVVAETADDGGQNGPAFFFGSAWQRAIENLRASDSVEATRFEGYWAGALTIKGEQIGVLGLLQLCDSDPDALVAAFTVNRLRGLTQEESEKVAKRIEKSLSTVSGPRMEFLRGPLSERLEVALEMSRRA